MTLSLVSMENTASRGSSLIRGRKKLKNRRTSVTGLGKGRSGALPVPLPGLCTCPPCLYAHTPVCLHGCHGQAGFPAGHNDTATGYFHKSSPSQGSFPQISPVGSQLPLRQPRAPAGRPGPAPVSLEGARVIFSTKSRLLIFITCAAL